LGTLWRGEQVAEALGELVATHLAGLLRIELVEPCVGEGRELVLRELLVRVLVRLGKHLGRDERPWPETTGAAGAPPATAGGALFLHELAGRLALLGVQPAVLVLVELGDELSLLPHPAGAPRAAEEHPGAAPPAGARGVSVNGTRGGPIRRTLLGSEQGGRSDDNESRCRAGGDQLTFHVGSDWMVSKVV
jgi:hypothetical protein